MTSIARSSVLILDVMVGDAVALSATLTRPLQLGRAPTCDVVLLHPSVSGQHALIQPDGDAASLRDLGSTNGTWVDGHRLTSSHVLVSGEGFRLGHGVDLRLRSATAPSLVTLLVEDLDGGVAHRLDDGVLQLPGTEISLHRRGPEAVWVTAGLEDWGLAPLDQVQTLDGRRFCVRKATSASGPTARTSHPTHGVRLEGSLAELRVISATSNVRCRVRAESRVALLFALGKAWENSTNLSAEERGWEDDSALSIAVWGRAHHAHLPNNYNVLVSRVRRDLRAAGLDPFCLERRPGQSRLLLSSVTLD